MEICNIFFNLESNDEKMSKSNKINLLEWAETFVRIYFQSQNTENDSVD